MIYATNPAAVPLAIVSLIAGLFVVVGIAVLDRRRRIGRAALPQGAEAALLSITEVVPDPRNLFAIKDPTSELRLSDDERRMALDAAEAARHRIDGPPRPARRAAEQQSLTARRTALAKHRAHDGELVVTPGANTTVPAALSPPAPDPSPAAVAPPTIAVVEPALSRTGT